MTEKFTPGEWEIEERSAHFGSYSAYRFAIMTNKHRICMCQTDDDRDIPTMQANAALIASAPTLYKMLKLACHELTIVADWCGENGMKGDEQCYYNLVNGIQDVLKKARGEE